MAPSANKLSIIAATALLLIAAMSPSTVAQNCGCAPNLCCSRFGYCGLGNDYCGDGCQSGPCNSGQNPSGSGSGVASIVTPDFFNGILNQARDDCEGKRFYTRDAFLAALDVSPNFGNQGSDEASRREIAAFFAHVTHETGSFCYIEEIDKSNNYCTQSTEFPCAAGKFYFGRGPLQLTGNVNYGNAGRALNMDLLNNPELVSSNPTTAFRTSLWYWTVAVQPVLGQGFGATTRAINGPIECNGGRPDLVQARANLYTQFCQQLNVSPGDNLLC